jgi:hypothetical protein
MFDCLSGCLSRGHLPGCALRKILYLWRSREKSHTVDVTMVCVEGAGHTLSLKLKNYFGGFPHHSRASSTSTETQRGSGTGLNEPLHFSGLHWQTYTRGIIGPQRIFLPVANLMLLRRRLKIGTLDPSFAKPIGCSSLRFANRSPEEISVDFAAPRGTRPRGCSRLARRLV